MVLEVVNETHEAQFPYTVTRARGCSRLELGVADPERCLRSGLHTRNSAFDIAAILAGLQEINSTLNSAVAAPLKVINQVEQQEQQFQQQVLYPLTAINSARQMANSFIELFPELSPARDDEHFQRPIAEPTAA